MSAAAFDASHPSALAIYCSDGRFTRSVEAMCRQLGHARIDTMTLPGGPALLNHGLADLSEVFIFSRATRFLIEAHSITAVVLLAHEGCGFYRARCGRLGEAKIKKLQLEHLTEAARTLRRHYPQLQVAGYYMRVIEGRIGFEDLTQVKSPPAPASKGSEAAAKAATRQARPTVTRDL